MEGGRQRDGANSLLRSRLHSFPALLLCATVLAGCQSYPLRNREAFSPSEVRHPTFMPASGIAYPSFSSLAQAEGSFATATRQEAQGLETCVDFCYRASLLSWQYLESLSASTSDPRYQAAWQSYQQSLARLITTGCRFGRLDPRCYLMVTDTSGRHVVPISYYGFAWKPNEFCQVLCSGDCEIHGIARHYRTSGVGVSLVAIRQACGDDPHYSPLQHFPATAVLRPARSASCLADGSIPAEPPVSGAVLEFYNPCLFDSLRLGPAVVGIERDLTAPFACLLQDTPRKFTEGFFDPSDADVKPKLFMMEPYQRGKIPVIFIHGLWSDPVTWVDAVNDLRAQGDIYRRYQFWFFRYGPQGFRYTGTRL
jgi:hypothetical protein